MEMLFVGIANLSFTVISLVEFHLPQLPGTNMSSLSGQELFSPGVEDVPEKVGESSLPPTQEKSRKFSCIQK